MENTDRTAFFAQYIDQFVAWGRNSANDLQPYRALTCTSYEGTEIEYLLLKPLSAISDEDAIEVAKITYPGDGSWQIGKGIINLIQEASLTALDIDFETLFEIVDFLRSKGYALPFRQYSVEQQVANGWIKLIEP